MFESVFDEHFAAEDYYTLFHDNGRFINHSSKPNLAYTNPLRLPGTLDVYYDVLIALRDIPSGDELTLDYNDCCPSQFELMNNFTERRDANLWPPKVNIGVNLNERKTRKA